MFYTKEITIDYLYLDLNTCDRCVGTDEVLDGVLDVLERHCNRLDIKSFDGKQKCLQRRLRLNISFYHPRLFM